MSDKKAQLNIDIKTKVEASELDSAIEKANELKRVLQEVHQLIRSISAN